MVPLSIENMISYNLIKVGLDSGSEDFQKDLFILYFIKIFNNYE